MVERKKLYTSREVAKMFRVHVETVRRWIKAGKLGAYRVTSHYRIDEDDLREYLGRRGKC